MHNVLKSSTDWKQVEKKFEEENKLKIKWEKKLNSIQIEKREWQRDKEVERKKTYTYKRSREWERLNELRQRDENESGRERVTTIIN